MLLLTISILTLSCKHPEAKKFERNQGYNLNSIDSSVGISENTKKLESQNNSSVTNKEVLEMEIQNGVRFVWIEINGLRLRFVFDTGASNVCISSAEATVLFRQGTLDKVDILSEEYFQDATGQISQGTKINLKQVKIGNRVIENVEALVIDNMEAPLLLGQSLLQHFGKFQVDNDNNTIVFE